MRTSLLISVLVVGAGLTGVASAEEAQTVSELLTPGRGEPLLIAHRGLSARYPENTMAAFRAAAEAGAEMLELDVGLSADGQVVVLHDVTLERTTTGSGELERHPWSTLKDLDAGSWFAPEFAGERLPLLAQVLDELGGRIAINIEIKPEASSGQAEGGIEQKVAALVAERGLQPRVVVSSFLPAAVARIKQADPAIRTAVLYHTELHYEAPRIVELYGADGLHLNHAHLTAETVQALHDKGFYVGVYTVNDAGELRRMAAMGVDGVFVDDVEAARAALSDAAAPSP